eukprot:2149109-Amphidinium_carterae.2
MGRRSRRLCCTSMWPNLKDMLFRRIAQSFIEAVRFTCGSLARLGAGNNVSSRVKGNIAKQFGQSSPVKQRSPLTAEQVMAVEKL